MCGTGVTSRSRQCLGCVSSCVGDATQTQSCTAPNECSSVCHVGWTPWSSCSSSCGLGLCRCFSGDEHIPYQIIAGFQQRETYLTQQLMNNSIACPNLVIESAECYEGFCSDCLTPAYGPNGYGCQNGGVCFDEVAFDQTFECICPSTFSGSNCQLRKLKIILLLEHNT